MKQVTMMIYKWYLNCFRNNHDEFEIDMTLNVERLHFFEQYKTEEKPDIRL